MVAIDGPLLKWFESFLVGRRQCVHINTLSSWTQVKSGVPQGSVASNVVKLL